ncbi:LuxR family transcriptional regulator [Homoserinibacter sp. YIM 151385]|uniref:LuxR family transcriptional regulator n=1 Tax=Homoserinibacter sp. YIM 151385 TaxID=2985506 RepID=UPI0022F044AB|nr:LuxR family transcriptional regulator [Homoserinibacter sp. YIM 151385]WBU36930.1 LuxR C-terminal-related transcriptional regulator [Homoserinibacter sp. YIM 151385]
MDPGFPDTLQHAVRSARADGDPDGAADAIEAGWRIAASEHGALLRVLVRELSPDVWRRRAAIAAALGASHRSPDPLEPGAALAYFEAARGILVSAPDDGGRRLAVRLAHAAALRCAGRLDDAHELLSEPEELADRTGAELPERIGAEAGLALERGLLAMHRGRLHDAERELRTADGLRSHLLRSERIEMLGALALIRHADGEPETALGAVAEVRALAAGTRLLASPVAAPALIAEQFVALERDELERAEHLAPEIARAARRSDWLPLAAVSSARLAALRDDLVGSLEHLRAASRALESWQGEPIVGPLAETLRAAALMALGQGDETWRILTAIAPDPRHVACPGRIIARLRLENGDLAGAERALEACGEAGDAHTGRTLVEVMLLRGAIEHSRERGRATGHWIDRALRRMAEGGLHLPALIIPDALRPGILEAAAARPQPEVVLALIEGLRSVGGSAAVATVDPVDGDALPGPLSDRELGVLEQARLGHGVAGVAGALYLSPNTVKTHLRNIYRKLGVRSREEAVRKAEALGLYL